MAALVIHILIQLVVGVVVSYVLGIFTGIPLVGWVIGLVCTLAELYVLASITLSCLDYFKILP